PQPRARARGERLAGRPLPAVEKAQMTRIALAIVTCGACGLPAERRGRALGNPRRQPVMETASSVLLHGPGAGASLAALCCGSAGAAHAGARVGRGRAVGNGVGDCTALTAATQALA